MRQRFDAADAADAADADRPTVRLLESSLDGGDEVLNSLDVAAGGPYLEPWSSIARRLQGQGFTDRQRIAAAIAGLVALVWLGQAQPWRAPGQSPAASAIPTALAVPAESAGGASPPVAVAPLCGRPPGRSLGIAGIDDSLDCPKATPGGDYRSAFVSGAAVTPFIVTAPAGWAVSALPWGNGVDLRALDGSAGVSFVVDPVPDVTQSFGKSGPAEGLDPMRELAAWITGRPFVLAQGPPSQTAVASHPGWVVTLDAPIRGADATLDCRTTVPCLPIFRFARGPKGQLAHGVPEPLAAGLPAGRQARFVVFQALGGQTVLAWEWVLSDQGSPALDAITQPVVDSVTY